MWRDPGTISGTWKQDYSIQKIKVKQNCYQGVKFINRIGEMVIFFFKYDAIDIADPSSMQDACHMNFVIDLAHLRVCGSVVEHGNAEPGV